MRHSPVGARQPPDGRIRGHSAVQQTHCKACTGHTHQPRAAPRSSQSLGTSVVRRRLAAAGSANCVHDDCCPPSRVGCVRRSASQWCHKSDKIRRAGQGERTLAACQCLPAARRASQRQPCSPSGGRAASCRRPARASGSTARRCSFCLTRPEVGLRLGLHVRRPPGPRHRLARDVPTAVGVPRIGGSCQSSGRAETLLSHAVGGKSPRGALADRRCLPKVEWN